jgi:iron(III) transport system substrate-binding protein
MKHTGTLWRSLLAGMAAAALAVAVPAGAQTDLVVYTSYENEDLAPYKAAFEKDHPDIRIQWVKDATGIITARLIAEKANPRADAIWGLAASSMGVLDAHDILVPYAPQNLDKFDPKFRDPQTPPRWFGNSVWIAAIVFNEVEGRKLGLPRPQSWKDLLNPAYKGRIVMPHPVSSGTGFLDVSAWLQTFGEQEGWAYMDALHQNIWRYTHSGSSPATLAGSGEAVIGIAFDIRGAREKARGAPIEIIFPREGLGWEMNAFGIVKGSRRLDAARKLADWAASATAMKLYGETRSVTAVPGYAKPIQNLPENLHAMIIRNDFNWASKNRERILQEWVRRYESKADPKK